MAEYWIPAVSWGSTYHRVTWGKSGKKGDLFAKYLMKDFTSWDKALNYAKAQAKKMGYDRIKVYDQRTGSNKFKTVLLPKSPVSKGKKLRITKKIPRLR